MLDFQQQLTDLNIGAFLKNIDWYEPWIYLLIVFHAFITTTTLLTRNCNNFQVLFFVLLLSLVYCSEYINRLAENNWKMFSKKQYFDTSGLFISLIFCVPILLNCMLMVANWLYQSRELMMQLKVAQLKLQQKECDSGGSKDEIIKGTTPIRKSRAKIDRSGLSNEKM